MINKRALVSIALKSSGVPALTADAIINTADTLLQTRGSSFDEVATSKDPMMTLAEKFKDVAAPTNRDRTAVMIESFLQLNDPDGTLLPALSVLTQLPVLSFYGEYENTLTFFRDGLLPSLYTMACSACGACPQCDGKVIHDESGHFCPTCED